MFEVNGGGHVFSELTASDAAYRARPLRQVGINDVEIFRSKGVRISLYALEQEIHAGTAQVVRMSIRDASLHQ